MNPARVTLKIWKNRGKKTNGSKLDLESNLKNRPVENWDILVSNTTN